jgi:hypothetical protein
VFIPMAGVAEFTLGFGLLWTPLIRRLSALALLVIFNAAVLAFGRMDLVGHALILMMMVVALAEPQRGGRLLSPARARIVGIPIGLAIALALFASAYWGSHGVIYGNPSALWEVAQVNMASPAGSNLLEPVLADQSAAPSEQLHSHP